MNSLQVLFEDEHILVVNKPAGLGTQAPRQYDSLESRVREYLAAAATSDAAPYLGIPHRLDRCATGVVVFAKTRKAAKRISLQFEHREVRKTYVAIVCGVVTPEEAVWTDYLRKVEDEPRVEVVDQNEPEAKEAVLEYRVLSASSARSKLEIDLKTGRMHQIRIQCGSRGYPVLGDRLYGSQETYGPAPAHERDRHIALQASAIALMHPQSKQEVFFVAPPLVADE